MTEYMKKKVNAIMEHCQTQSAIYNNYQLGTKVVINGIYGAFGFSGFYFYNTDIAESVTKQGKNAILNSERLMNKWAKEFWQKDTKTHKLMGIKIIDQTPIKNNISVYIDTDSIYASFEQIINVTDWFQHDVWRLTQINKQNDQKEFTYVSTGGYPSEEDAREYFNVKDIDTTKFEWSIDTIEPCGREFCLTLNRVFMSNFLKKIHEAYAEKNGTPNILDFELEAYNEAGIWLSKKKYVKNMTWSEPNVYYDSCEHIKATGIEIAQTSSSAWVKKQLTDMVKWIFQQETFTIDGFLKEMKRVKKQFMMQSPETVSVNKGMNKYSDYVMCDTDCIELGPKAMVTVQGASFYNWLVNNNPKFKKKYGALVDSDKLCVVYIKPNKKYTYWKTSNVTVDDYAKNPDKYKMTGSTTIEYDAVKKTNVYQNILELTQVEAFSYPSGTYPMDLTAGFEIDYDRMFELLVMGPMNRIIEAMGYQPMDICMTYQSGLF